MIQKGKHVGKEFQVVATSGIERIKVSILFAMLKYEMELNEFDCFFFFFFF